MTKRDCLLFTWKEIILVIIWSKIKSKKVFEVMLCLRPGYSSCDYCFHRHQKKSSNLWFLTYRSVATIFCHLFLFKIKCGPKQSYYYYPLVLPFKMSLPYFYLVNTAIIHKTILFVWKLVWFPWVMRSKNIY